MSPVVKFLEILGYVVIKGVISFAQNVERIDSMQIAS